MQRDIASKHIQELTYHLMMGTKGQLAYNLPTKYQNHSGSPLFQAMGDLLTKGRVFHMGGSLLEYDYCMAALRGCFYDKVIEFIYPPLVNEDLYIVYTTNNKPHALTLDVDANTYTHREIRRKSTYSENLWEFRPNEILPASMTSPILSKFLFTKTSKIRDDEILTNKALR